MQGARIFLKFHIVLRVRRSAQSKMLAATFGFRQPKRNREMRGEQGQLCSDSHMEPERPRMRTEI
jgi:hypothetical protein